MDIRKDLDTTEFEIFEKEIYAACKSAKKCCRPDSFEYQFKVTAAEKQLENKSGCLCEEKKHMLIEIECDFELVKGEKTVFLI